MGAAEVLVRAAAGRAGVVTGGPKQMRGKSTGDKDHL